MFVSVIVPTRNRPKDLRVALTAITRQTHDSYEVIVIDDSHNSDVARENERTLREFGSKFRYMRTESLSDRGSGPALVRNIGLRHAGGALAAFCDDDDYWCDDRHLEIAVRTFAEQDTIDLVFANHEARHLGALMYTTCRSVMLGMMPAAPPRWDAFVALPKEDCLRDHFPHLNTWVLRRSLCERIGGFWETIRYSEDLDFFLRAVDSSRGIGYRYATVAVHNVPDRSTVHTGNASTVVGEQEKHASLTRVAEHVLRTCQAPEVRKYAEMIGGNSYRWLAINAQQRMRYTEAARYASRGLALRPTWRWHIYTLYLQSLSCISF